MLHKNIFISVDLKNEATQARYPFKVKRYASDGKNIPLKKNWSDTWCTLPSTFDFIFKETLNYDLRQDDVFVVTFMKSGTTWMQECAWLLLNDLNFKKSKESSIAMRSPLLELHGFLPEVPNPPEICNRLPSPRLIKSHMPANLLPLQIWENKQKIIYVARNVKDVIVSSYHFVKNLDYWRGNNIAEYVEDFLNNDIPLTNYWNHVLDFWKMRNESFIFFVTYEEMQRDLKKVLEKLCVFLERPQLSKDELEKTLEHLNFKSMKANKSANLTEYFRGIMPNPTDDFEFMRRGIVGSFKDELTPELICKIDNWSADFLGQYGLKEEYIFGKL